MGRQLRGLVGQRKLVDGSVTKRGTLKLLGSGDVDHLDPSSAYYTVSYTL